jgi:hypothetical protein
MPSFSSAFLRETTSASLSTSLRLLCVTPRNCFWLWLGHVRQYASSTPCKVNVAIKNEKRPLPQRPFLTTDYFLLKTVY